MYICLIDSQPHERNTHGDGYGRCSGPVSCWKPEVGDFIAETLFTDTRTYEVVGVTAQTIRIRSTRRGDVVKRENRGGNPWPCVWHEEVSDPTAEVRTLRRRKDGTFRMGDSSNPMRPATVIDGKVTSYTDYRE